MGHYFYIKKREALKLPIRKDTPKATEQIVHSLGSVSCIGDFLS